MYSTPCLDDAAPDAVAAAAFADFVASEGDNRSGGKHKILTLTLYTVYSYDRYICTDTDTAKIAVSNKKFMFHCCPEDAGCG